MSEYRLDKNPQRKKEVEKRTEKVVAGTVKTKKRGEMRKLADNLISEEVSNIKTYLVADILIPTIKNTIWDAITNSLDMVLFGGSGRTKRSSGGGGNRFSYDKQYRSNERLPNEVRARSRFEMDDIIFESRGEAESVLEEMYAVLDEYQIVRVADLYDMAGLTQPYTSNRWGWTNLRNAQVNRVRDGFIIELPSAMAID